MKITAENRNLEQKYEELLKEIEEKSEIMKKNIDEKNKGSEDIETNMED